MTRPLTLTPTTSARKVTQGVPVAHVTNEPLSKRIPKPREHWKFLGRERHYGYDYWVWELVANPLPPRKIGRRWSDLAG